MMYRSIVETSLNMQSKKKKENKKEKHKTVSKRIVLNRLKYGTLFDIIVTGSNYTIQK